MRFCLDAVDDKGGAWRARGEAVRTVAEGRVRVKIVQQLTMLTGAGCSGRARLELFPRGKED